MLIAVGCSQAVAPTSNNLGIPPGAVKGEYGFNINGKVYDSGIPTSFEGSAQLSPYSGQSAGAVDLFVSLYYYFNNVNNGEVNLNFSLSTPKAQSMTISNSNVGHGAYTNASFYSMGINYGSLIVGTVNITKFDTINNLVSGTFEFTASESSPSSVSTNTATITSGYFNDMPISTGSYGQGSVTATINDTAFMTNNNGFEQTYAGLEGGSLDLWANGHGLSQNNEITIQGIPVGLGTYVMNDSNITPNIYCWNWANEKENVGSRNPASTGQLTITMCDTVHRRISGIFQFTGIDSLGNMVTISNGVINNVQWIPN